MLMMEMMNLVFLSSKQVHILNAFNAHEICLLPIFQQALDWVYVDE